MSKPPHKQGGQQQITVQHSVSAGWSGPLPPPEALAKFNEVVPNGAERIMAMAEIEQRHRIDYETTGINASVTETRRGQWLGASISLIAIVGAIISIILEAHWAVSCALVGVPILGIIKAIVNSRHAT